MQESRTTGKMIFSVFFFSLVKWLWQYSEYSNWQLRTQRCTLPVLEGRKKQTKLNRYWKENKSNNKVVCESSKAQWDYREQTTKYNLDEFIFRQNKRTTVQKAVWNIRSSKNRQCHNNPPVQLWLMTDPSFFSLKWEADMAAHKPTRSHIQC